MLYERVVEVDERVRADGTVEREPDLAAVRAELAAALAAGIEAVAIVFMHAYRYPAHEQRVAALAREMGFPQVSVSHEVSPLIKLVGRGDTTVVDAYLSPILARYVAQVAEETGDVGAAPGVRLMFMMSSGGLTAAELFQGKDAILSGPAGGVVGMAETGREAGFSQLIGFDMGGTSTDVSHFDGEYERAFETEVAGVRMRAPMMLIHTVAAGGGSILHFDGARFRVGPDSAGANPGTEVLSPRRAARGHRRQRDGRQAHPGFLPEDLRTAAEPAARRRRGAARRSPQLAREIGDGRSPEEVADGFIKIAVENMANAIKKISVQRGYDVTRYALNCFGGAGGQHACLVADALGMTTVLIHPFSSLLSAYGMGLADIRATRQQAIEEPLGERRWRRSQAIGGQARRRTRGARSPARACPRAPSPCIVRAHIRYAGTDTALVVPAFSIAGVEADDTAAASLAAMKSAFEAAHKARFGFIDESKELVVEAVSVEAVGGGAKFAEPTHRADDGDAALPARSARASIPAARGTTPRSSPASSWRPATRCAAPPSSSSRTRPSWSRTAGRPRSRPRTTSCSSASCRSTRQSAIGTQADPVMLEVFNNLFMSIAEQMGVALQNTAYSVNIKERLDFSCAVFAADGTLVANAPHMPVHLGSMDRAVETIIRENRGRIAPGRRLRHQRALQRRHPPARHHGVHAGVRRRAARESCSGWHRAATMPTSAASRPARCRRTRPRSRRKASISTISSWSTAAASASRSSTTCSPAPNIPARNPLQNVNDLKAQIAANEKGVQELRKMVAQFTLPVVEAYMQHVQDNAAESVRRVIDRLHDCAFAYEMDQGTLIKVKITVDKDKREATVDFTGTSPQQTDQFQRARAGDARRRALCLPRDGRRRHPDERRLPAADQHRHPEAVDAVAGISGRGGRRQRGDVAGRDRHACSARSARSPPRRAP